MNKQPFLNSQNKISNQLIKLQEIRKIINSKLVLCVGQHHKSNNTIIIINKKKFGTYTFDKNVINLSPWEDRNPSHSYYLLCKGLEPVYTFLLSLPRASPAPPKPDLDLEGTNWEEEEEEEEKSPVFNLAKIPDPSAKQQKNCDWKNISMIKQ